MTAVARGLFERRHHPHLPVAKDILAFTLILGLIVAFVYQVLKPLPFEPVAQAAVAVI